MRSAFIGFSVVGVIAIILMVWYQIASIAFVGSSSLCFEELPINTLGVAAQQV